MEGSVQVDTGVGGASSDTSDDIKVTGGQTDTGTQQTGGTQGDEGDKGGTGEGQDQKTDKGTKLDPNPQSAVHQQLANAEKKLRDYETVLRSPELLRKFAKAAGYTLEEAKAAIEEEKSDLYSGDKLQTGEDVAKALNELRSTSVKEAKTYQEKIAALEKKISSLESGRTAERVTMTLNQEVSQLREKYPELNPKDPSYDPELEHEIGKMYEKLDKDPQPGGFRGQPSLLEIADLVMKAAGKAKKKGSEEAQTDVKVKERGKVTTSSKATTGSSESEDAGTAIAQRIAKAIGRK